MSRTKDTKKKDGFIYADPYVENSFGVVLSCGTSNIGTFTSVSGGAMEISVISYTLNTAGGSSGILMPGACGFEPITLAYGVTDDTEFWKWWVDMSGAKIYRRVNLELVAYGALKKQSDGTYKKGTARWDLANAWPSRISGFNFDLDSTSAFIAEVTLIVENITRTAPTS